MMSCRIALVLAVFLASAAAADSIAVSRLCAADGGTTHFADEQLEWQTGRFELGAQATDLMEARELGFFRMPVGYDADWHPAPRKQYVMVLQGTMEVEAGDGEKRQFGPGTVLLVTDVEGPGHRTRVLGEREVILVWVPVP